AARKARCEMNHRQPVETRSKSARDQPTSPPVATWPVEGQPLETWVLSLWQPGWWPFLPLLLEQRFQNKRSAYRREDLGPRTKMQNFQESFCSQQVWKGTKSRSEERRVGK